MFVSLSVGYSGDVANDVAFDASLFMLSYGNRNCPAVGWASAYQPQPNLHEPTRQ